MMISGLVFVTILGGIRGKSPSTNQIEPALAKNLLINDDRDAFRAIRLEKVVSEPNGGIQEDKLKSAAPRNKTGERFLDEILERRKKLRTKEARTAVKPLLLSLIDALNVINSLNRTTAAASQFNSTAQCSASGCALNCELQDQLNNGKSGFCSSDKAIHFCQCCSLKHRSCLLAQQRCRPMGLRAVCNGSGQCAGDCVCTLNSCLKYCVGEGQKSIRSSGLSGSASEVSASATCSAAGQCVCRSNESGSPQSDDDNVPKSSNDKQLNPIYAKVLLNNKRARLYDSIQINFSNMLRMLKLMANSMARPESFGLNLGVALPGTVSPSGLAYAHEKEHLAAGLPGLENLMSDNEKVWNYLLAFNKTTDADKNENFGDVFENRLELFKNQRNLIISKLIQMVGIEKKAGRTFFSRYLDDLRVLLASNLHFTNSKIEELKESSIDDFEAIFHLTMGIKNALQLCSLNLT